MLHGLQILNTEVMQ